MALRQYSDKTNTELREVIEDHRQNKTFGFGPQFGDEDPSARIVRIVRALEDATAPYSVLVEFGNPTFDDSASGPVTETFSAYSPQVTKHALLRSGTIENGDVVKASLHYGKWYIDDSGSSACHTTRFRVISVDTDTRVALCELLAIPAGCSDVPGSSLVDPFGTVLEVCDPSGCFFDETQDDLTGRMGGAHYMLPLFETTCQPGSGSGSGSGTGTSGSDFEPQWEVVWLCCQSLSCDA